MFEIAFADVEDPRAGPDTAANAAFVQEALDACAGRVYSGVYGNLESIPRIVGETVQFAPYIFWDADGRGVAGVVPVAFNGLVARYDQYRLNAWIDGVLVDIDCRLLADGVTLEYGLDLSNFSLRGDHVPDVQWFRDRWDEGYRFIIFGTQRPAIALQQVANAIAAGTFALLLYIYLNFPGGEFDTGISAHDQMAGALDAMGVPAYVAPPAPPAVGEDGEMADLREIKGAANIQIVDQVEAAINLGNVGQDGRGDHAYVVMSGTVIPPGKIGYLQIVDANALDGIDIPPAGA